MERLEVPTALFSEKRGPFCADSLFCAVAGCCNVAVKGYAPQGTKDLRAQQTEADERLRSEACRQTKRKQSPPRQR
jgi:hypothetical protein